MKIAQLPDGSALGFPDNAHDEQMDKAVQAYLGISEQKDTINLIKIDMLQALVQQVGGLVEQVASLSQVTLNNQAAVVQSATALSEQIGALASAMTAPKKIVKDENGSPIGVVSQ